MNADLARAQMSTLKEWADIWHRDSQVASGVEGYGEVVFLLRRTAAAMAKVTGDEDAVSVEGPGEASPRGGEFAGSSEENGVLTGSGAEIREG